MFIKTLLKVISCSVLAIIFSKVFGLDDTWYPIGVVVCLVMLFCLDDTEKI